MALVKCGECGKQVSDKANTCPACGNPIRGGGGSVGNDAFERRIEQYKKAGYKLGKRNGNSVTMTKLKTKLCFLCLIPYTIIMLVVIVNTAFSGGFTPIYSFLTPLGFFVILLSVALVSKATISLTTTGKIEETGNILKKK